MYGARQADQAANIGDIVTLPLHLGVKELHTFYFWWRERPHSSSAPRSL